MTTERKTEQQKPVTMYDQAGKAYTVTCSVKFMRVQTLDGAWTDWQQTTKAFMCGAVPVNQLDDGWFELLNPSTRIRPRQP